MLNTYIENAYKVLYGKELTITELENIAKLQGEDILDLISLANKVKNRFVKERHLCTIINARSGLCKEDCKFCTQSVHYNTSVEVYELIEPEKILVEAKKTYSEGVKRFGIVTSGTGYSRINREFSKILKAIALIQKELPDMSICASLGTLSEDTVMALAEAGLVHYNINLQTNQEQYHNLVATTHSFEDRINTIHLLKKVGIKVCCGCILGLGETMMDRINLALELNSLKVDVIPINVLIPLKGTPVEDYPLLSVDEIAKTFAIFRLINPDKIIKFAAGRETILKDFQGLLMFAGVNGFITGGYLTTRGRSIVEDMEFIESISKFCIK